MNDWCHFKIQAASVGQESSNTLKVLILDSSNTLAFRQLSPLPEARADSFFPFL